MYALSCARPVVPLDEHTSSAFASGFSAPLSAPVTAQLFTAAAFWLQVAGFNNLSCGPLFTVMRDAWSRTVQRAEMRSSRMIVAEVVAPSGHGGTATGHAAAANDGSTPQPQTAPHDPAGTSAATPAVVDPSTADEEHAPLIPRSDAHASTPAQLELPPVQAHEQQDVHYCSTEAVLNAAPRSQAPLAHSLMAAAGRGSEGGEDEEHAVLLPHGASASCNV